MICITLAASKVTYDDAANGLGATVQDGLDGLFARLTGLTFADLVVAHWFGFTAPNIPESVQNSLLNIVMVGIGSYVVGRSGEKIADKFRGPN